MVWVRAVPLPRKGVRGVSSGFPISCRWRETPCQSSVPIPLFAPNGRLSLAVGGRENSPAEWGRCRMLSQFCDILLGSILWELPMSRLTPKPTQGRWVSGQTLSWWGAAAPIPLQYCMEHPCNAPCNTPCSALWTAYGILHAISPITPHSILRGMPHAVHQGARCAMPYSVPPCNTPCNVSLQYALCKAPCSAPTRSPLPCPLQYPMQSPLQYPMQCPVPHTVLQPHCPAAHPYIPSRHRRTRKGTGGHREPSSPLLLLLAALWAHPPPSSPFVTALRTAEHPPLEPIARRSLRGTASPPRAWAQRRERSTGPLFR